MAQLYTKSPWARFALKALIAGVLLYYVVRTVSWASVWEAALSARPIGIIACAALLPVNIVLESLIWRPFLTAAGVVAKPASVLKAVLGGFALGIITPARVGEFVGRSVIVTPDRRLIAGLSVAVARLPEIVTMFAFGLVGLVLFSRSLPIAPRWAIPLAFVGMAYAGAVTAILVAPTLLLRISRTLGFRKRGKEVAEFLGGISRKDLLTAFGLSILRYTVFTTQFVLALWALNVGLSVGLMYISVWFVFMARGLLPPVTIMDLGIREGLMVWAIGLLGGLQAAALDASLVIFTVNLLIPALVGTPMILNNQSGTLPQSDQLPKSSQYPS